MLGASITQQKRLRNFERLLIFTCFSLQKPTCRRLSRFLLATELSRPQCLSPHGDEVLEERIDCTFGDSETDFRKQSCSKRNPNSSIEKWVIIYGCIYVSPNLFGTSLEDSLTDFARKCTDRIILGSDSDARNTPWCWKNNAKGLALRRWPITENTELSTIKRVNPWKTKIGNLKGHVEGLSFLSYGTRMSEPQGLKSQTFLR